MDELDLLKKDWHKTGAFVQVSDTDIHKMAHRNSSSIVKWLLIISIMEFAFWTFLTLFLNDDKYEAKLRHDGIDGCMFWVNAANYAILLVFMALFYKNYRNISAADATHTLMHNILKTRKTVQYYIWYNLAVATFDIVFSIVMLFRRNVQVQTMLETAKADGRETIFLTEAAGVSIAFVTAVIFAFWLFYKLLYGILLKKLFVNYKELGKSE